MKFSWTANGETWFGLLVNNRSTSCYTSLVESDLDRRIAIGVGSARTLPLTREDLHMLAFGVESDRKVDDITFEWADASEDGGATRTDEDVVMREGVSITVTKIARTRTAQKR